MFVILNNAGDIFVKLVFPFILNQRPSVLDCKNKLNIQLCVRICHDHYISSLRDLVIVLFCISTNMLSLTGHLLRVSMCGVRPDYAFPKPAPRITLRFFYSKSQIHYLVNSHLAVPHESISDYCQLFFSLFYRFNVDFQMHFFYIRQNLSTVFPDSFVVW